ncbi:hypothetical protein RHSP_37339 [Rhizobium freirei PRF 81]|uniref:Uncharacterized protein n=1 Tax=Rhizobium freirei PRF 81 TaxID=363754 RepID=N6UAT5_9HYPH|nr:hypothetical protein RHSP_37339 [Rhizobium freirei PRF 81]
MSGPFDKGGIDGGKRRHSGHPFDRHLIEARYKTTPAELVWRKPNKFREGQSGLAPAKQARSGVPKRLHGKTHEEHARATHDQPLMRPVEAPHGARADDADQDEIRRDEANEGNDEQQRQGAERQRTRRAGDKGSEGRQRDGISLWIGHTEDQAAAEGPVDSDERFTIALRLGSDGAPADPGQIEAAQQSQKVEDEGADGLGADNGNKRKRRPDEIAQEMAADEKRPRLASLSSTDAEQRQEGRAGNQHIEKRRQKSADNKRLRHDWRSLLLIAQE